MVIIGHRPGEVSIRHDTACQSGTGDSGGHTWETNQFINNSRFRIMGTVYLILFKPFYKGDATLLLFCSSARLQRHKGNGRVDWLSNTMRLYKSSL
jgi:hypothetical protein